MNTETKNTQPFEILTFSGKDSQEALQKMQHGLKEKLETLMQEGRPMKPCGPPFMFQEYNLFKIVLLLWIDHTYFVMGIMTAATDDNSALQQCDHSCGYENINGLVCKKCGTPLM